MLRRFTFENFCSLRDPGVLDFTASAATGTNHSLIPSPFGDQITVLSGAFGGNASGKTTLLKALTFVNFFLRHSYRQTPPDDPVPIDSFAGREDHPTRLGVEFEGPAGRFRYELSLTKVGVRLERLSLYGKDSKKFKTILLRKYSPKGEMTLTQNGNRVDLPLLKRLLADRPNASMIAAGLTAKAPFFQEVIATFGECITNVNRQGKIEQPFETFQTDCLDAARFLHEHPEYHDDVKELLVDSDLGIIDYEIREMPVIGSDQSQQNAFVPIFHHQGPDGLFELSIFHESAGTRRLFMLFAGFLPVLGSGGTAIIDEMESDLHPHLIPMILGLFADPESNPHHAQLLFTCHHLEILNHLQKEQIILVEKNAESMSEVYRLADVKGVRREENFFANYNSGKYDAVPELSRF